ncbi:MAG: 50S ribosomal protein L15 [Rhodobacteraceae bacterium]|nr:50S ribosomal protein L15 [Paracoccaceae bacterium]
MKLHELRDDTFTKKKRRRVGRGPGSGMGKTAGRGYNGQKSRSGVALGSFEGGQMPIYQRLPKRGFNNYSRKSYAIVNLGNIQKFIDNGKINPEETINSDILVKSGLVRRTLDGIRVLANGEITTAVNIEVKGASQAAIKAVEKVGGSLLVATS